MSSSSLSSLLGLAPPPPVIAPSAVDKRLSKTELRVATAAFHRARGYGDRVDFPRFRDTVLQEAFDAMPLYVTQRVFMVWNYAGGGALSLKEFLVGVAIAWKGTQDEHLKFAFQLMDRHGAQELTKRDTLAFLRAVAMRGGVVAVEKSDHGKTWTIDEFLDMLFPADKTLLTPASFLKTIASRPFKSLVLVDWIPKLALQFEREKEKLTTAVTPVYKPSPEATEKQGEENSMVDTIMVKLRRIKSSGSLASTTSSTTTTPAMTASGSPPPPGKQSNGIHQRPTARENHDTPNELEIIQIETMNADQFQSLKRNLADLIRWVLSSTQVATHKNIRDRLSGVVPDTVLQATQSTADACAGDFLLSASCSPTESGDVGSVRAQSKATLLWWIVCICCSLARSSSEVLRYLFVLFDEDSQGFWTRAQLTTFIRCADFREEEQSSEQEAAYLAQTVLDEIAFKSQLSTAALAAVKGDDPCAHDTVSFRFRDFETYLARYPISGCSAADIDLVFTLLHADLAKHRGQQLSHRTYLQALHSFCDQLIAHELTTQLGFCLLQRPAWERLVEWMCDYDKELPLMNVLKSEVCTPVENSEVSRDVIEESQSWEDDYATLLVAVPISLWLVLATKHRERSIPAATSPSKWTETATQLTFSTPASGDSEISQGKEPCQGSWTFCALVATIRLTVAARDGSECVIDIPHCVVDREVTLQTLVQTALSLHGRERASVQNGTSIIAAHPKGAFFCEGEVAFFDTSEQQCQNIQVSQGILLIALSTLDEGTCASRMKVTMDVVLTDERSNSHLPRWQSPMVSSPASSQRSGASTPSSRTPRNSKRAATTGWSSVHGLANLGNTCFMNSALQCLAATPVLREYFLKGEHLFDLSSHTVIATKGSPLMPGKKTSSNGKDLKLPKSSLLPVAFGQLLAEMNAYSSNGSVSGMADVISPKYMKTAIATLFPHLSDGSQQDAQEFLSSLLSSLSDELTRLPISETNDGSLLTTQATTSSLVSRFTSFSRSPPTTTADLQPSRDTVLKELRFQVSDSNGRCDSSVAKEWWISHLIAEPSVITALFCGQFKSTLRCNQCGYTSTRFEPFSSLQLPLMDETEMLSPRRKRQQQQVVVVLHFLDSPCHRPSLRIVVQVGGDWTVEQLLIKIQQDHATYSNTDTRRDHIAVTLNGFTVDDYVDPDALLSSVSTPINVFEIEYGEQARAFGRALSPRRETLEAGTKVLVRASHERWVKAVVERPGLPAPDASPSGSPQPADAIPLTYHLFIEEAGMGARVCLGRSDIRPRTSERYVLLRFLHRRPGLVPFYSTSPYRQVICGFPFLCRLPSSQICGRGLYHMVHRKFAAIHSSMTSSGVTSPRGHRSFILKRVRSDGKCCGLCHWTGHCDGCKIDRFDEAPLELAMDETVAIDWSLDAHEQAEEWLASGCRIEDHTSYAAYRIDSTHSLEKSLQILCSEERVEARCSRCLAVNKPAPILDATDKDSTASTVPAFVPHTKTLALWSLPPILVIQLKRFELVRSGGYSYQRLNHSVDFDVDGFDMASFLATHDGSGPQEDRDEVVRAESFLTKQLEFPVDTASRELTSYRLYGLVNHMGNVGGGHYTAHIRHPDNGDWWLVDDASATPANPQTLSPSSSAYLLFYVREDLDPTTCEEDDDYELDKELAHRPRGLSDFYPRQPNATPVADAAVRALCKQDFWQRLPTSKQTASKRDDNCALM